MFLYYLKYMHFENIIKRLRKTGKGQNDIRELMIGGVTKVSRDKDVGDPTEQVLMNNSIRMSRFVVKYIISRITKWVL